MPAAMQKLARFLIGEGGVRKLLTGRALPGMCPICERGTLFLIEGPLRDFFLCNRCRSIPRWRAVIHVLNTHFPNWRDLHIHESSPAGASSVKLTRECKHYLGTRYFPDVTPGEANCGIRCEDLERLTFADELFDLVITQDVFEHILDPVRAFQEVARTLKPGGAHVFTIPWYHWKPTLVRAVRGVDGRVRHLEAPDYHGNPIEGHRSLVVTEWGSDFCDYIRRCCGLETAVVPLRDWWHGLIAKFLQVFISRKPVRPGNQAG